MISKRLRPLWMIAALGLVIGCSPDGSVVGGSVLGDGAGGAGSSDGTACLTPPDEEQMAQEILRLVNEVRREHGLNELTWSEQLAEIAGDYGCTLIEGGFFSHHDPDTGEGPGERAIKAGYLFLTLGENLAGGQSTPEAAMEAWMESESHRANILNPIWDEMGLGVRQGGEFGTYWVQEFGDPP